MAIAVLCRAGQHISVFGHYLAEILRSEGLADHDIVDINTVPVDRLGTVLAGYDAVVLARMNLTKKQADVVAEYVEQGGRLVAVRPQLLLAQMFGMNSAMTMTDRAYVRPVDGNPIGSGLPLEPIQTHVPADNYHPTVDGDTTTAAQLYGDGLSPSSFPAVVHVRHGAGQVVVFTYDVAQAVSRIRQGDPDRVGGRGLGYGPQYRSHDLLMGYADPACWHLPQADIHAMLLGNAVNTVARNPQPRWWYFPTPELKSVLVLDSDDDWSAPEHFDALIEGVEKYGGHITIYLMLSPSRRTVVTPEQVAEWRERGHSFGIHHDAYDDVYGGADEEEALEHAVRAEMADFVKNYGGVPVANRNHCGAWKGYAELPKLHEELGVQMDLNMMSIGSAWLRYLNGSGRPMRFVDLDGRVIDVFQQLTEAYDDMSVQGRLSTDAAAEAAATRKLMETHISTYFSPVSMLSHPVSFFSYSQEYQERCWAAARELDMPIWSAAEWAMFTRARDGARMRDVQWSDGEFQLTVVGTSPQGSMTLMLPVPAALVEAAEVDDVPVDVTAQQAFGWDYTLLKVELDPTEECTRHVTVRLANPGSK